MKFKFLILLIIVCPLTLSIPKEVSSETLKPLGQVMEDEDSIWGMTYLFERCASVSMAVSMRLEGSGRDDVSAFAKQTEKMATQFLQMGDKLGQAANENISFDSMFKNMKNIVPIYQKEMDQNWAATGAAIDGVVATDLKLCTEILKNM